LEVRVWGLEFGVQGLGFRVGVQGLRVQGTAVSPPALLFSRAVAAAPVPDPPGCTFEG